MYFNYPNIISLFRVVIAPIIFYLLVWDGKTNIELVCFLYFLASISDFFDGWVARKLKTVSNIGKFFDPLADKILTTFAFLAFVLLDVVQFWMVLIVILRDFGTTYLRVYTEQKNILMSTSLTAKWKTFLQMIFIAYILILFLLRDSDCQILKYFISDNEVLHSLIYSIINYFIMLVLTAMSLWTLIEYIIVISKQKNNNS